ncbi:MAG: hypothetical protein ACREQC_15615, partial [Candidatus Binataceae bacterium]
VLLPSESAGIVLTSLAGAAIFLPFFRASTTHALFSMRVAAGLLAALLGMIIVPMWIHPLRKRLMNWVLSRLPA